MRGRNFESVRRDCNARVRSVPERVVGTALLIAVVLVAAACDESVSRPPPAPDSVARLGKATAEAVGPAIDEYFEAEDAAYDYGSFLGWTEPSASPSPASAASARAPMAASSAFDTTVACPGSGYMRLTGSYEDRSDRFRTFSDTDFIDCNSSGVWIDGLIHAETDVRKPDYAPMRVLTRIEAGLTVRVDDWEYVFPEMERECTIEGAAWLCTDRFSIDSTVPLSDGTTCEIFDPVAWVDESGDIHVEVDLAVEGIGCVEVTTVESLRFDCENGRASSGQIEIRRSTECEGTRAPNWLGDGDVLTLTALSCDSYEAEFEDQITLVEW